MIAVGPYLRLTSIPSLVCMQPSCTWLCTRRMGGHYLLRWLPAASPSSSRRQVGFHAQSYRPTGWLPACMCACEEKGTSSLCGVGGVACSSISCCCCSSGSCCRSCASLSRGSESTALEELTAAISHSKLAHLPTALAHIAAAAQAPRPPLCWRCLPATARAQVLAAARRAVCLCSRWRTSLLLGPTLLWQSTASPGQRCWQVGGWVGWWVQAFFLLLDRMRRGEGSRV